MARSLLIGLLFYLWGEAWAMDGAQALFGLTSVTGVSSSSTCGYSTSQTSKRDTKIILVKQESQLQARKLLVDIQHWRDHSVMSQELAFKVAVLHCRLTCGQQTEDCSGVISAVRQQQLIELIEKAVTSLLLLS